MQQAQHFNMFAGVKARPIIIIPDEEPRGYVDMPAAVAPPRQEHTPPRKQIRRAAYRDDSDDEVEQLAAAAEYPARARGYPVAQPVVIPVIRAVENLDALSEVEKTEMFWNLISAFQWRNASDGNVNARAIQAAVARYSPAQRQIFADLYNHHFDIMKMRLDADGMFERNEVRTLQDQAKVISHAIAMGMDQFNTLIADPEFYQFFVENGECQSLDVLLPVDMQH